MDKEALLGDTTGQGKLNRFQDGEKSLAIGGSVGQGLVPEDEAPANLETSAVRLRSETDRGSGRLVRWNDRNNQFQLESMTSGMTEDSSEMEAHQKLLSSDASLWSRMIQSIHRSPEPQRRRLLHDSLRLHRVGQHEESPLLPFSSIRVESRERVNNASENSVSGAAVANVAEEDSKSQPVFKQRAVKIASIFLNDYERGRPPSLPSGVRNVSTSTLFVHSWKFSRYWPFLVHAAAGALFVSSCFEGYNDKMNIAFILNTLAIIVYAIDVTLSKIMLDRIAQHQHRRISNKAVWIRPITLLLFALSVEMTVISWTGLNPPFLWTSLFKPIALFYDSRKARCALEALRRIAPIVSRVLMMELLLILSFATVACQLYSSFDHFQDLSTSWLSLFQLSTTVVNPSMWMPMYNADRRAGFFFVLFDSATTFYIHSLVLSVVFQTYLQAATEIHERYLADREEAIQLSFGALQSLNTRDNEGSTVVDTYYLRQTLRKLRPHYNAMKINALIEVVDPLNKKTVNYSVFRVKIRQALSISIKSTPTRNFFAALVEFTAAFVAVSNFAYVILLTSNFQAKWFDVITFPGGAIITLLGIFELTARVNPFKICRGYTPSTRFSGPFDGLAILAAVVSCHGIVNYFIGMPGALDLLLTGRSIDMIRVQRFFRIFRDIVRRSGHVFPALAGPFALLVSTQHIFCYVGLILWSGALTPGRLGDEVTPLYDLNNFNSYWEGQVTLFQVLVVNDWHAISEVFLHADWNSSPYIVCPFFVIANLVCVNIMLNCLIAFFVGGFVAKLDDEVIEEPDEIFTTKQKARDFTFEGSARSIRRISSNGNIALSASSSMDEMFEFDVYEREGYDKIMRTVAGATEAEDHSFAKHTCSALEVFESLTARGAMKHGFLVVCQSTLDRSGNRRFHTHASNFMSESELHAIVSTMHAELVDVGATDSLVHREFHSAVQGKLEISASLLRVSPAVSLFVSRIESNLAEE